MSSALEFPCETLPPPGDVVPVAAGVSWVRMPLPFALDHVNLWLLDEADGVTAVDTGIALDGIRMHWLELLKTRRLLRQIVTHCHPDHFGLAAWLQAQTGAAVWMTQGEYAVGHLLHDGSGSFSHDAMIELYRRHGLDEARQTALETRGNAYRHGVPALPASYRRLFDGDVIDIGGRGWRVIAGYGHSPEHAALYCDALHVLISGDMLLPRITSNVNVNAALPDGDALRWYLASIERFAGLPPDTLVLPSHGKPFRGLHLRIAQLQRHHQERCAALLAACTQPRSAAGLLPALFDRDIGDPHQLQFAMAEAIAHLNYLENQQRIVRVVGAADGVVRYSLPG